MKKIFYLVFLIILCFLFNIEINAEEIDCNSQEYACLKCEYNLPFSPDSKVQFIIYSDGTKLNYYENTTTKPPNDLGSIPNNYRYTYSGNNFKSGNKLVCPQYLYYSIGGIYNYNFSFSNENLLFTNKKELVNSSGNGKEIFKEQTDILSCNYEGINNGINYNINIESNGKQVWTDANVKIMSSAVKLEHFLDNSGNLKDKSSCPTYYFYCESGGCAIFAKSISGGNQVEGDTNLSGDVIQEQTDFYDGTQFKKLLGSLKTPLSVLAPQALKFTLTIDGNKLATLESDVTANDKLCSGNDCSSNASGYTEQGLKNIVQYCNILYEKYPSYKNEQDNLQKRMDECIDFYQFYGKLIANGIVQDLSEGCEIFSSDLKNKLVWILNLIKIAGPILALGLGTLDFIKVLANGDADKEMKTASKRFMIRLGAAALLFIIPLILAFLLDVFLGNKDGYDPDNPFCVYIDWNE